MTDARYDMVYDKIVRDLEFTKDNQKLIGNLVREHIKKKKKLEEETQTTHNEFWIQFVKKLHQEYITWNRGRYTPNPLKELVLYGEIK